MIQKIVIIAGTTVAIYLAIAIGLILSQTPGAIGRSQTLDFARLQNDRNMAGAPLEEQAIGGAGIQTFRRFDSTTPGAPLMVLLHGSGWHGGAYQNLARLIADQGAATVILPDLRGHGPDPERRGDVDYIGQFEDDIAALIEAVKTDGQKVVLAGHSSGGGLVIRFCGGRHGSMIDAAVLLAPFLQHDAPTMRPNSGGWAHPLVRRIIGLTMLNWVGVTALNHLTAIQFAFPQSVLDGPGGPTATPSYSYRLNTSFAPRPNYQADIARLPDFLLLVGEADEAFRADMFEPTLSQFTDAGQYAVLPDIGHLDLVRSPGVGELIADFLRQVM